MIKTKKLKIGYQNYKLVNNTEVLSRNNMHGLCHKDQGVIEYNTTYGPQALADTLVHEVLHAIWFLHLDEEEVEEEKAVTMLAHGLCQVIKDNPKFIKEVQGLL